MNPELALIGVLGLGAILVLAAIAWVVSLLTGKVAVVDSFWPLFFIAAGTTYAAATPPHLAWKSLLLALLALWGGRLAAYLTWRNWGAEEDRRYAAIRSRHEPGFQWKSLYLIFGLQGVLAWIVSLPILAALQRPPALPALAIVGVAVILFGIVIESVADCQLARFRARRASLSEVMDRGLWAFSRHPNYFGEACVWWGWFLVAASCGGWWTVASPLLMTFLLLRVSGVSLLEADLVGRNPAYADYCRRVPAFFPRLRRATKSGLLLLSALPAAHAMAEVQRWDFAVTLNGSPIGFHRFELQKESARSWTLVSEARFTVKFWVVPVYRYEHKAVERWEDGCLSNLEARTNDNGQRLEVRAWKIGNQLLVRDSRGENLSLNDCVWTFAYWNTDLRSRSHLLNPQTGQWIPVRVQDEGEEELGDSPQRTRARRYSLLGPDFRIDVWYDGDKDWVRLESEPQAGRKLRYERLRSDPPSLEQRN
jgi:steroid 5-alpha reductase family enzyme